MVFGFLVVVDFIYFLSAEMLKKFKILSQRFFKYNFSGKGHADTARGLHENCRLSDVAKPFKIHHAHFLICLC
jgi:hypothetical protein